MIRFEGRSLMGDRDDIPLITLVTANACYFTVNGVNFVAVMTKKEFLLRNVRLDLQDAQDWRRLDDMNGYFVTAELECHLDRMRRELRRVKISPKQVIRSACIRKNARRLINLDQEILLPLQICEINWGNENAIDLVKVSKD